MWPWQQTHTRVLTATPPFREPAASPSPMPSLHRFEWATRGAARRGALIWAENTEIDLFRAVCAMMSLVPHLHTQSNSQSTYSTTPPLFFHTQPMKHPRHNHQNSCVLSSICVECQRKAVDLCVLCPHRRRKTSGCLSRAFSDISWATFRESAHPRAVGSRGRAVTHRRVTHG